VGTIRSSKVARVSGLTVEILNIKVGGTYSYHCALKCYMVDICHRSCCFCSAVSGHFRFKVSVTKLSVTEDWKASNSRMLVNNGLERICKEAIVV
jgi:hypothetical protein